MSPHEITIETAIVAFKTITLLLGGLITYLALKAYRRTQMRPLLALSVGFGIVTVGVFLAGVADQVIAAGFQLGLLIESALLSVGFAVIVYSLYATTE
jgi:Na+-transporting methylmalonyl-CoA/oxaloacetate decarboxylase beta subunit